MVPIRVYDGSQNTELVAAAKKLGVLAAFDPGPQLRSNT